MGLFLSENATESFLIMRLLQVHYDVRKVTRLKQNSNDILLDVSCGRGNIFRGQHTVVNGLVFCFHVS